MKRKMMMTAFCATAVMLAFSIPLVAQTSRTSAATASTFGTDVDNYMSVNDFSSVDMDKWFGYISLGNSYLDLGYARKMGSMYLGTYYDGLIVVQPTSSIKTSITTDPVFTNGQISSTNKTTTKVLNDNAFYSDNEFQLLFGIAGMGFKLGFDEELLQDKVPDGGTFKATVYEKKVTPSSGIVTVSEFKNYSDISGFMTPSLAWGMNIGLGGMTLKPNAEVSVRIQKDAEEYAYSYSRKQNGDQIYDGLKNSSSETYALTGGYIAPGVLVGADLAFGKKDGAQSTVGLKEDFEIHLYGDGIKTLTKNKSKSVSLTEKVSTETTTDTLQEDSFVSNTVTPSYGYTRDLSEKVTVALNAKIPVSIVKSSTLTNTTTTEVVDTDVFSQDLADDSVRKTVTYIPGDMVEISTTTVSPELNLGFVYKVKPGKFQLNSGLSVSFPEISATSTNVTRSKAYKQTVRETNGLDVVTVDEINLDGSSVDIDDARTESGEDSVFWNLLSSTLSFGGTFNFTKSFALDFSTSLGTSGTASLFGDGTDGILASSMNLQFTIKY